jgi:hypothetical protein
LFEIRLTLLLRCYGYDFFFNLEAARKQQFCSLLVILLQSLQKKSEYIKDAHLKLPPIRSAFVNFIMKEAGMLIFPF